MQKVGFNEKDTPFNNSRRLIDYSTRVATDNAYMLFYQRVHPDKTIRDASKRLSDELDVELNELGSSQEIYKLLSPDDFDPVAVSPGIDREMYDDVIQSMRRSGCHLSKATNKEAKEISEKLAKLGSDFHQNLTEAFSQIELDGDEILSMDQFCKDQDIQIPENNTLLLKGYGLYTKIIMFCPVESVRRKAYIAFNNTAKPNIKILEHIQKLRDTRAKLLGYENHAEYRLEINTIGTPQKALEFLRFFSENIGSKLSIHQKLVTKVLDISEDDLMKIYNNSYYLERYRVIKHNVDAAKYIQYFELNAVLNHMLRVYEEFFEITISQVFKEDLDKTGIMDKIWHEDVQTLVVSKAGEDSPLGMIHIDLTARDGKMSHPSCFPLIRRHEYLDGTKQSPTAVLICSFQKAENGKPTLLQHGDVNTLFHEFGHTLHEVLNEVKYGSLGGTAITRDLVEVPSMYLEYLCWDPKFLRKIARHYKTDEPLTDAEISALVSTKHIVPSFGFLKQLAYSLYDLQFHMNETTVESYTEQIHKIAHLTGPNTGGIANFGHLIGYDAQYYTYLFSRSYAAMLNKWLGGSTKPNINRKKYLEFLRYSNKERLIELLGENNPKTLIDEIFN